MSDEDWRAIEREARVDPSADERRVRLLEAGRAPEAALRAWREVEKPAREVAAMVAGSDKALLAALEDCQAKANSKGRIDDTRPIWDLLVRWVRKTDRGVDEDCDVWRTKSLPPYTEAYVWWESPKTRRDPNSRAHVCVSRVSTPKYDLMQDSYKKSRERSVFVKRRVIEAWAEKNHVCCPAPCILGPFRLCECCAGTCPWRKAS